MWMDPEGIIPSEMSEKERQICYVITYVWNWKNGSTNEYQKTETEIFTGSLSYLALDSPVLEIN